MHRIKYVLCRYFPVTSRLEDGGHFILYVDTFSSALLKNVTSHRLVSVPVSNSRGFGLGPQPRGRLSSGVPWFLNFFWKKLG
jgi:hypothetical protein